MSATTGIEWADSAWPAATVVRFTEGNGRERARVYRRTRTDRPGTQERRRMRALGKRWCRGCSDWLPANDVGRQGTCKPCANAEYRAQYATDGRAIRARAKARKRGVSPLPLFAADLLTESFGGLCAYCPAEADSWDHILPIASSGDTAPGNVVPACTSCNSSKKAGEVLAWLSRTGRVPNAALWDVLALDYLATVA